MPQCTVTMEEKTDRPDDSGDICAPLPTVHGPLSRSFINSSPRQLFRQPPRPQLVQRPISFCSAPHDCRVPDRRRTAFVDAAVCSGHDYRAIRHDRCRLIDLASSALTHAASVSSVERISFDPGQTNKLPVSTEAISCYGCAMST